jgi:hypothetical protein
MDRLLLKEHEDYDEMRKATIYYATIIGTYTLRILHKPKPGLIRRVMNKIGG